MSKRDDGGPAFPRTERNDDGTVYQGHPGMSLRDWIAGQALAAIIAADGAQYFHSPDTHAEIAYSHADAMLKAREVSHD